MATGDHVRLDHRAAVISLKEKRRVLSTSLLNGGLNQNIEYIFNYDEQENKTKTCKMLAPTHEAHMKIVAEEILGLPINTTTGLTTAAQICNAAYNIWDYEDISLSTLVTGGVTKNALRVGDNATLHQKDGEPFGFGGTINIILAINADLSEGTMLQALMTCTEAKTAVLQSLGCCSVVSGKGATGTGTDGVIIIANPSSDIHFTDAGKHFKLGELIGKAVMQSVNASLHYQEGWPLL